MIFFRITFRPFRNNAGARIREALGEKKTKNDDDFLFCLFEMLILFNVPLVGSRFTIISISPVQKFISKLCTLFIVERRTGIRSQNQSKLLLKLCIAL